MIDIIYHDGASAAPDQAEAERWGYIDPSRWNAFYRWLSDNNLVEQPIPENTGFSNDYLA